MQSEAQDIWQLQEYDDFSLTHLYDNVTVSRQNNLLFLIYVNLTILNARGKKNQKCSNNYKTTLQLAAMSIFHLQISTYKHGYTRCVSVLGILLLISYLHTKNNLLSVFFIAKRDVLKKIFHSCKLFPAEEHLCKKISICPSAHNF